MGNVPLSNYSLTQSGISINVLNGLGQEMSTPLVLLWDYGTLCES